MFGYLMATFLSFFQRLELCVFSFEMGCTPDHVYELLWTSTCIAVGLSFGLMVLKLIMGPRDRPRRDIREDGEHVNQIIWDYYNILYNPGERGQADY